MVVPHFQERTTWLVLKGHVYLFAFHGPVLLLVFEETTKYFRRRGHSLEFLG